MIRKSSSWLVVGLLGATLLFGGCASQEQKKSIEKTNEGVKALNSKQYDVAIGKLEEATKAYRDNHTAWYNLGLAYARRRSGTNAAKSYEQAVKLSGSEPCTHEAWHLALQAVSRRARFASQARGRPRRDRRQQPRPQGRKFEPATQELGPRSSSTRPVRAYTTSPDPPSQDDAQKAAEAFTRRSRPTRARRPVRRARRAVPTLDSPTTRSRSAQGRPTFAACRSARAAVRARHGLQRQEGLHEGDSGIQRGASSRQEPAPGQYMRDGVLPDQ